MGREATDKATLGPARRTGDISISSVALESPVTSRVYRRQRDREIDREGKSKTARGKLADFNRVFIIDDLSILFASSRDANLRILIPPMDARASF